MKTYYLTRDIKARDGRIHAKGGSIQTSDPEEQKFIEDQLNAPMKQVPIAKPKQPPQMPPPPGDIDD